MSAVSAGKIAADFDQIAQASHEGWDHNSHYHDTLLRQLPPRLGQALDLGCGTGDFSRRLAQRAEHVLGLDLSPGMVEVARARSSAYPNLAYKVADITQWEFPIEEFDCIASIATLHHVPLAATLDRISRALRPGGTLVVLDLYKQRRPWELAMSALAIPANVMLKLAKTGRLREPPEVRRAWTDHGRHDSYLTIAEIRRVCAEVLPGARIRRHLLWRYSLVWRKPRGPDLTAPVDTATTSAGNRR